MTDHVEVWLSDSQLGPERRVGSLRRSVARGSEVVRFAYAPDWTASTHRQAFAIDPDLPLGPGDYFTGPPRILPGIFRDTAPDRWGRVLMERREAVEARSAGRPPKRLGEWDFLLGVSDAARLGALRLRDPLRGTWLDDREPGAPPAARLRELEAAARAFDAPGAEQRTGYADWLQQLVVPGSSLGGARPKASFVDEDGALWLAKFPAHDDRRDVGVWEHLAWQLAVRAGIDVPDARSLRFAGPHHSFCVRRFDRVDGGRRLFASAMTLVGRDDGDPASYLDIAQALQQHGDATHLHRDLHQLYRRIVFAILVGNRDDHLRNHGFLREPSGWVLSPAFDVNPNPDKDVHVLALDADDPTPDTRILLAHCEFFRLSKATAATVVQEVREAVRQWPRLAAELGAKAQERSLMTAVIDADR
jgi:serine/threonine-protein kinase HipA